MLWALLIRALPRCDHMSPSAAVCDDHSHGSAMPRDTSVIELFQHPSAVEGLDASLHFQVMFLAVRCAFDSDGGNHVSSGKWKKLS